MSCRFTSRDRDGFILQEIIVGVVIFGIAMLPLMRALRMIPQMGAAIAEQSRREAWRSATDGAVLLGVDPSLSPVMQSLTDGQITETMTGQISRHDLPARTGGVQVSVISDSFQATAEDRSISAGFEIGPGTLPGRVREDPLPPLPPIKLPPPGLNPINGTFVSLSALTPSSVPGAPFLASIRATSGGSSDLIHLHQVAPVMQDVSGLGVATLLVDAMDLAHSVRGQTWAEYAGNPAEDIAVPMEEGRTRWLVRVGGRTQVYEPSDPLDFIFGVDLGRPVYRVAGVEYDSGSVVGIDYAAAVAIESGRSGASITYPQGVKDRFGSAWPEVIPNFRWSFGEIPGDASSGNTVSLYGATNRARWNASQTLTATPTSGLPGLRLLSSTWTVQRQTTTLEPPERGASFYDGLIDAPDWVDFSAPVMAPLSARIGRPEVNGVESVNESLSVPLVP